MTITTTGPLTWVDGPLPIIRTSRLLDVATIPDDPDPHWRAGAQIYSYPPDVAHVWNPCGDGTFQGSSKAEGAVIPIPVFGGFQVYLAETCTMRGLPNVGGEKDQDAFVARATAAFAAVESHGVELVLASGTFMEDEPYLGDTDLDILNGGAATGPIPALCLLEQAIGKTGRGGTIHADPGTVTAWESTGFTLDKVGGKLVTRACGTPIAVGTGYIGTKPDAGAAPTAEQGWAFATGPVTVRRGDVEVVPGTIKEALNRTTNEITYRVERDYLVDWDTVLQAGVLVGWTL
jgi:hypothetical protein